MSEIQTIKVGDLDIKKIIVNDNDYLCISDFVPKDGTAGSGITIMNWLRAGNTISFLGLWEKINNHNFNVIGYDDIKKNKTEKGNVFSISTTQWVKKTNAIGITSKAGRYNGGTYAHIDIAMEFATWLSPEFKLYLITEFKRLKKEEAERNNQIAEWDNYRWLSKINYRVHTDAIKDNLIPILSESEKKYIYANEADMLNKIVFGMTNTEFRKKYPNSNKNIRDELADTQQLVIIANLESLNAKMVREHLTPQQRFDKLIIEAYEQGKSFKGSAIPPRHRRNLFNQEQPKQKEQDNPTSAQFIKNIQVDDVELKDTDFEANITKVAFSKIKNSGQ